MKRHDLIGQTFGYLTVIKLSDKRRQLKERLWECRCVCGNITYTSSTKLLSGKKKSCGCLRKGHTPPSPPRFAPFVDCISYRPNFNTGCVALKERLCENTGKCKFYKPKSVIEL